MSARDRKLDLEILTFVSGLATSIASATGYFYGSYAEEFGPVATFIIVTIWLILVFMTLKNSRNDETATDDTTTTTTRRILNYFLLGWSFTLSIWFFGIGYNWFTPRQVFIDGYILYEDDIHLENATVEVYYGNKKFIDHYSDIHGYFSIQLQREVNQDQVYLRVFADSFNPDTYQITLSDNQAYYSEQYFALTPQYEEEDP
ncbi:MAG: hypothetical protein AAF694_04570 [Bacteroidota bacterium]